MSNAKILKTPKERRSRLSVGWRYKKDNKPPNDAGGPLRVIVNTLAIFVISQFVAAFIVELAVALIYRDKAQDIFNQSIAAQFFFVLVAEGLAVWLVLWLLRRRSIKLSFIGLGRKPKGHDLLLAVAGYGGFLALSIIAGVIINLTLPGVNIDQNQNLGFSDLHGAGDSILAFVALVILPPLGEEPLVRGYLYSGLRKHWRFASALLATSLLFGLAHLEIGNGRPLVWGAAIDTFVLSAVLCFLREKTGALYAGILVHLFNNILAFATHFHF